MAAAAAAGAVFLYGGANFRRGSSEQHHEFAGVSRNNIISNNSSTRSSSSVAVACCYHHRRPRQPPQHVHGRGRGRRSAAAATISILFPHPRNYIIIRCGLEDFIGGDLVRFDLGRWLSDVEEHKALAIYSPFEGGYEGRYFTRLRYQGYHFLDLSARGLGDPETTLTKIHPVCPAHLGRQPIARWYFPPEVDYRLSLLPPNAKGLVVWIIEAKVLSKSELQFLALLPSLRPKVKVIAECGNWRKFMWKPLKEIAGLDANIHE